jgi:hypothetical protein
MSRGNRRRPRVRQEPLPGTRFALTRPADLDSALPLAEAFTALELEFFRKGDELEAAPAEPPERGDPPDEGAGEPMWGMPAADPAS